MNDIKCGAKGEVLDKVLERIHVVEQMSSRCQVVEPRPPARDVITDTRGSTMQSNEFISNDSSRVEIHATE